MIQFNFVGRILGPRGMTAKQLEQETGCKIMVRGRGSMRDKKKVNLHSFSLKRKTIKCHYVCGKIRHCHICRRLLIIFAILQEEQNRGKPNWEHLNDELHVLITVEDTENRAKVKLQRAVDEIRKLLVPAVSGLIRVTFLFSFAIRFSAKLGSYVSVGLSGQLVS